MLHIIIDGAGDIPEDWKKTYNIQVVPINIHFGEKMYLQGEDLSNSDFYRLAEESGTIPKTSQPSPQQFVSYYKKIASPGDTILSIHVTSKLSGTYDSAKMAAQELEGEYNVIPFDSGAGSAAMAYMAREARKLIQNGISIEKVMARLDEIRRSTAIVLTLENLEYARKSGRVKALQAALASILNVKPIVALKDGALDMADRVRTRRRALNYLVEDIAGRFGGRLINAAVVHAEDPSVASHLAEQVRAKLNICDMIITELSIAVAANLGPGTVGIVAYPVEER